LFLFLVLPIRFSRYGLAKGPRRSYELITVDSTRNTKGSAQAQLDNGCVIIGRADSHADSHVVLALSYRKHPVIALISPQYHGRCTPYPQPAPERCGAREVSHVLSHTQ
jgi:hypothetical protein